MKEEAERPIRVAGGGRDHPTGDGGAVWSRLHRLRPGFLPPGVPSARRGQWYNPAGCIRTPPTRLPPTPAPLLSVLGCSYWSHTTAQRARMKGGGGTSGVTAPQPQMRLHHHDNRGCRQVSLRTCTHSLAGTTLTHRWRFTWQQPIVTFFLWHLLNIFLKVIVCSMFCIRVGLKPSMYSLRVRACARVCMRVYVRHPSQCDGGGRQRVPFVWRLGTACDAGIRCESSVSSSAYDRGEERKNSLEWGWTFLRLHTHFASNFCRTLLTHEDERARSQRLIARSDGLGRWVRSEDNGVWGGGGHDTPVTYGRDGGWWWSTSVKGRVICHAHDGVCVCVWGWGRVYAWVHFNS